MFTGDRNCGGFLSIIFARFWCQQDWTAPFMPVEFWEIPGPLPPTPFCCYDYIFWPHILSGLPLCQLCLILTPLGPSPGWEALAESYLDFPVGDLLSHRHLVTALFTDCSYFSGQPPLAKPPHPRTSKVIQQHSFI